MIKAIYKLGTVAASGAVILSTLAPIAAAANTTVTIQGNGAFSDNTANLNRSTETTVTQRNNANIQNNVTSSATTGENSSFGNTGGNVSTRTGNASTESNVTNTVNANTANVANCGGCVGNTAVKIAGNGVASDNTVNLNSAAATTVDQDNNAYIRNNVESKAKTGGNRADLNTGGDVAIFTGKAQAGANVANRANSNVAQVGATGGTGSSLTVDVLGNGAFSANTVNANLSNSTKVNQANDADIYNDVNVEALTGYNSAFGNTGGDVLIGTGNASTRANVLNDVNRNWANINNCDCLDNVAIKIAENGAAGGWGNYYYFGSGSNDVNVTLDNAKLVDQANKYDGYNNVDDKAKTGGNDINFSVGATGTDPLILTGNAVSETNVSNTGNVNTFGATTLPSPFPMPTSGSSSSALWASFWAFWLGSM